MPRRAVRSTGDGRSNVVVKLEERVKAGDFYGALQMYKTIYSRHFNAKEWEKAREIAYNAVLSLAAAKQKTAASEMGGLMVDAMIEGKVKVSPETKKYILDIHAAFEKSECIGLELAQILKAAIKWTASNGSRKRGDPELQLLVAKVYEHAEDFASASKHYLHTEKPIEFSKMLLKWAATGNKSECDLFLTRTVLQLASLENLRDANAVYKHFTEATPGLDTPLINFLRFLLLTLERDALPLFQLLQQKYGPSLQRDDSFKTYLSLIGQKYYGIQPPKSGLSALMSMLGGGM